MKTEFPFIPLLISAGAGGIDAVVASSDLNAGRTALLKQRAVWVQGGLLVGGLAGEFMGLDADYTEPLMGTAIALIARELAFKAAQSGRGTAAVAPQGYQAYINPPDNGLMNGRAATGIAGWREVTAPSISG